MDSISRQAFRPLTPRNTELENHLFRQPKRRSAEGPGERRPGAGEASLGFWEIALIEIDGIRVLRIMLKDPGI